MASATASSYALGGAPLLVRVLLRLKRVSEDQASRAMMSHCGQAAANGNGRPSPPPLTKETVMPPYGPAAASPRCGRRARRGWR